MPPRRWHVRIQDILEAIAPIESYLASMTFEQFCADRKTVDAVVRNLEGSGEAARHIDDDVRRLAPTVPWADLSAMRNVLVHAYFGVDVHILWQTVTPDLPPLRSAPKRLLE